MLYSPDCDGHYEGEVTEPLWFVTRDLTLTGKRWWWVNAALRNEKVLSSKEHSTHRELWAGGRGHREKYTGLASSPVIFLTENDP